ncbi:putative reverse transcriptase domain-containing protein [Tanacetum coccineum]
MVPDPTKVEGDKTPPPGDVSFDSMSSDSELEDEEVDTMNLKARFRASRAQARFMRLSWYCQTEIALLKSKNKMGEKERELLNHDLENVERALGNVLERILFGDVRLLRGGAGAGGVGVGGVGPAAPEITECTYITFMKCDPYPFKGTEGAVGLCQWFEKLEFVFRISDCKERDKVKFATATLQGRHRLGGMKLEEELYNLKLKGIDIDRYTNQFHELALLCPRMVEPEQVKVEQYIHGLLKNIRGDVTSSRPFGIDEAIRMAYQLMGQIIQDKTDEVSKGEKRKGEGDRGGRGENRRDYNRRQNQRRANVEAMTNAAPNDNEVCPKYKNKKHAGDCWKCGKCGKLGHKIAACSSLDRKDMTCFNCNEKGHRKRDCPKLKKNGQGGNNVKLLQVWEAVDASKIQKSLLVELDTCYEVELANGKVGSFDVDYWDGLVIHDIFLLFWCGEKKYTEKGCELFLAQVTEQKSKEKRLEDVPVIQDFPEVFPKELPGLPPPTKQDLIRIDLILRCCTCGLCAISIAPSEMRGVVQATARDHRRKVLPSLTLIASSR